MALLGTLRRLRSRSSFGPGASPSSDRPASPPLPPLPPSSAQTIAVAQASVRLRADAGKIGYAELDSGSSEDHGATKGEPADEAPEEEQGVESDFVPTEKQAPPRGGLVSRATKRWSSPAPAPPFSTIIQPQPKLPSPQSLDFPLTNSPPGFSTPLSPSPTCTASRGDQAKRRASSSSLSSATSHSLSPSSSFRSPPTSTTSLSSASSSSLHLNLTISTRLDSGGRRVLTSRRRPGDGSDVTPQPTPPRCKRTKGTYGIGEEEESLWRTEEAVPEEVEKAAGRFEGEEDAFLASQGGSEPLATGIGLGLVQESVKLGEASMETLQLAPGSDTSTPTRASQFSLPTLSPSPSFAESLAARRPPKPFVDHLTAPANPTALPSASALPAVADKDLCARLAQTCEVGVQLGVVILG
ncbi:hypothetical protein JCM10213v2_007383 [Rhodosporidiobolus nylandii]